MTLGSLVTLGLIAEAMVEAVEAKGEDTQPEVGDEEAIVLPMLFLKTKKLIRTELCLVST